MVSGLNYIKESNNDCIKGHISTETRKNDQTMKIPFLLAISITRYQI